MLQRAPFVEAVGHRQRLAVIGDGDVAMSQAMRGGGHGLEIVAAIGRRRVHVEVATEVGERQECGQSAGFRRLDFTAALTELGCDKREA